MSIYQLGTIEVSDRQKENVVRYLSLTEQNVEKINNERSLRFYLGILSTFENSVEKAANAFNSARTKAFEARKNFTAKAMKDVPFPEKENFFLRFHTIEEGKVYWGKIMEKGALISEKIMKDEFYGLLEECQNQEFRKEHTFQ